MLFAVVGAIWTISIMCMTFATVYFFNLHRKTIESFLRDDLAYAWDKYRLFMLYTLGLAVFYLGTARLTSQLSGLIMSQLSQRSVPLWYPDRWLTLSAICAVLAFMIGLLNRGEFVEGRSLETALDDEYLLPEIRSLPTPVIRPEDSTTYLRSVSQPLAPVNVLETDPTEEAEGLWLTLQRGAVPAFLTTLGICIVAVIGWLLFTQSGVSDRVGQAEQAIAIVEPAESILLDNGSNNNGSIVENTNASIAIPARPTEDPSSSVGRSNLGNQESAPAQPESVQPIIEPADIFTSSIPITLVSPEQPAVQPEPIAQPESVAQSQPVSEPTAAPAKTPMAVVQGSYSVNARLSPDVQSTILTVVPSGSTLPIQEWSPNGEWILVALDDGRRAWVAAWVVEVITSTF